MPSRSSSHQSKKTFSKQRSLFKKLGIFIGILLVVGIITSGGIYGYYKGTEPVPAQGGTLHEGVLGTPQRINPLYASSNQVDRDLVSLIYPSLFEYNAQSTLEGELVQANGTSVSNNGKTYTFTLKQDVQWEDGEDITAEDVIFTIRAIQNREIQSPLKKRLTDVKLTKVDAHTVKMNLPDSYSPFKSRLTFGILPEHKWSDLSPKNYQTSELNVRPVGAGPYTFESLQRSNNRITQYTLTRNEQYFGETPYIDKLVFHFYTQSEPLISDFEQGKLTSILPLSKLEFDTKNQVTQHRLQTSQYFALFFNTQKEPMESEVLRKALRLAIDKEQIVSSHIGDQGQALYGPLTSINRFYVEQSGNTNPQEAKELLSKEGWKDTTGDSIRTKDGQKASFEIIYSEGGNHQQLLQAIKNRGKDIGIQITLKSIPFSQLRTKFVQSKNYDYDALYAGQAFQIYPDPYVYWHSSQIEETGLNLSQYSVIEVDKFLESARTNTDSKVIQSSLAQFQTRIQEDIPAIFTHSRNILYYTRPSVNNVSVSQGTNSAARFQTLPEWYIETKREWRGFN